MRGKDIANEKKVKYRVQLDFSEEAFNELNELKDRINAVSRAEVVRDALSVLKWVLRNIVDEEKQIIVKSKDGQSFQPIFTFLPEKKTVGA